MTVFYYPSRSIDPVLFSPYGQLITPTVDGKPYDPSDAELVLDQGIPRFYIMHLENRGLRFHHLTRHRRCTQCLGSLGGQEWFLAVCPPEDIENPNGIPDLDHLAVFRIPGTCFVKLHRGTWHAGPFFKADWVDFYNLELSDTNVTDHHTCFLPDLGQTEVEILP